jgi:hypothetical protein
MHSCSSLVLNLAHPPALSGHVVQEELEVMVSVKLHFIAGVLSPSTAHFAII